VVGEALWVNWDGVWAGLASEPTHDGETVMNGAPGFVGRMGFCVVGEALWVNWDGVWAGLASVPTHDDETVMNGAPGFVGGGSLDLWEMKTPLMRMVP
jgi:hypothetical protein